MIHMLAYDKNSSELDAICYDITGEGAISGVEELRSSYDKAYLIMVADISISPVEYMKPTIMASSLLLRPLSANAVSGVMSEMIDRLAVEAREKKIFACTDYAEYAFYETLENLGARLPDCFKRCHRSYIVNTDYITRIVFKEMSVYLGDSYIIPVSRSYREAMREYKYGKL